MRRVHILALAGAAGAVLVVLSGCGTSQPPALPPINSPGSSSAGPPLPGGAATGALSAASAPAQPSWPLTELESSDGVIHFAVSADGAAVATYISPSGKPEDDVIRIWQLPAGAQVRSLAPVPSNMRSLAFSPDGKALAAIGTISNGAGPGELGLQVLDAETGSVRFEVLFKRGEQVMALSYLAFSPDGTRLVCSLGATLRIIDLAAGTEQLFSFVGQTAVWGVACSPTDAIFAVAHPGLEEHAIELYDLKTGQLQQSIPSPVEPELVAFSADGSILATASSPVAVWDTETWAAKGVFSREQRTNVMDTTRLSISPTAEWIAVQPSGLDDKQARVFNVQSGEERRLGFACRGLAFLPSGNLLVLNGFRVQLIDPATGARQPFSEATTVRALPLSPKPRTALPKGPADATADAKTASHTDPVPRIAAPSQRLEAHSGQPQCVAFGPKDNTFASGANDGFVVLWRVGETKFLRALRAENTMLRVLAWDNSGGRIAIGGEDGIIRLWTLAGPGTVQTPAGHAGAVAAIAFSPDSQRLATGGADHSVRIWDLTAQRELMKLTAHTELVRGVAFNPDGTQLASVSWDGTARLWDAATGSQVQQFVGHEGTIDAVDFSRDGRQLVTSGSDAVVRLWDVATAEQLQGFKHPEGVAAVKLTSDALHLVTGCNDGIVRVWNVATGQEMRQYLTGHPVLCISLSQDGLHLATVGLDDLAVAVWDFGP